MTFLLRPTAQVMGGLLLVSSLTMASPALAQTSTWPERPIRVLIPAGAGTAMDIVMRKITPDLTKALGQAVIVENRPGAAGRIATAEVSMAASDGYTLLHATQTGMILHPLTGTKISYDPIKDFIPVARVSIAYPVVAVATSSPALKLADLKNLGRSPTIGLTGLGSYDHATSLALGRELGVVFTPVPFSQGTMAALLDAAKGSIDVTFTFPSEAAGLIAAGKIRVLATMAPTRNAMFPDVPSIAETAAPDTGIAVWSALFAPAGTPPQVIERLRTEINNVINSDAYKAWRETQGAQVDALDGPGLTQFFIAQRASLKKIVDTYGLKSE
ncbi:MAG: tripartite tricarboxylate transporter substrate binding protein [Burkholderiaceae bacterium]